jgi:hypothetical protein
MEVIKEQPLARNISSTVKWIIQGRVKNVANQCPQFWSGRKIN